MAFGVKPEDILSYFDNMFAHFVQIILTTIRFDHTMLIFFKLIEITIKIMNAGVFLVGFSSSCWR